METIKCAVIGAGVIGLALARELSAGNDGDVVVFEKNARFGEETSSRNSEVIHAGIYYEKDSLKSRLCLQGNRDLYEFCGKYSVPHKKCGKLIVATNEAESAKLDKIFSNASSIGVPGLSMVGPGEISALEPDIYAVKAIYSETTGIVDSHVLMQKLFDLGSTNGAVYSFGNEVTSIMRHKDGYVIKTSRGDEVLAKSVINSGGLYCDKIAEMAGLDVDALGYRIHFCKGDYFSVSGAAGRLKHLVYPPPHDKGYGLGVHATIDLSGRIRLGPDTEYVDAIGYNVDPKKNVEFYSAAKKFLPWLKQEDVVPDTSGMRPKLQGPDDPVRDFVIREESSNGLPGFVNLLGMESPGLTSCLAISRYAVNLLAERHK